jgi:hypothetical protein
MMDARGVTVACQNAAFLIAGRSRIIAATIATAGRMKFKPGMVISGAGYSVRGLENTAVAPPCHPRRLMVS